MNRGPAAVSRTLCLLLAAGLATPLSAAEAASYRFEWVRTLLGPCCSDIGADLVVDAGGGVWVTGQRGGLDLDRDGTVDVQTHGSPDPVVLRSFADDTDLWVKGPGGPSRDEGRAIALDGAGGAYVVGHFEETMVLDGTSLRSAGRRDGFLVRYGPDGETLWALAIGGVGDDQLDAVASDAAGNAWVVGAVRGAVDLDGDGTVDVDGGAGAGLLAAFDSRGSLRQARSFTGPASVQVRAVALGEQGEVYVGGLYLGGPLDLDGDGAPEGPAPGQAPAAGSVTPQTDISGYFARFDADGSLAWARMVTGPAVQVVGSLSVADGGDLLVLGGMTADTDLDGDGVVDLPFESLGANRPQDQADGNSFLLRVRASGESVWAKRYRASANRVTAGNGRIVVTGTYSGVLDLDGDGSPERGADDDPRLESFVAILDREGTLQQTLTVVGGDSDVVNAAALSPDGRRLYVTGYVKLGADFDGDDRPESASACHQLGDLFLARYDLEG